MNDNQLVYAVSIICLLFIIVSFKVNRLFGVINSVVFLLYSTFLYYNLFFKSGGGMSLVWWFYLLLVMGIHMLSVGIFFLIKLLKTK